MKYYQKALAAALIVAQVFCFGLTASAFENSLIPGMTQSKISTDAGAKIIRCEQLGSEPVEIQDGTAYISYERFSDLIVGAWYQRCVAYTLENGYFTGLSGTVFSPESKMTRIQFMTIMYRIGETLGFYSSAVTTGENWRSPGIELSSTLGFKWSSKDLEDVITREEVCAVSYTVLYNHLGNEYVLIAAREYAPFTDESKIEPDYLSAIKSMYISGGIDGYPDGSFKPENNAKRCEIAKFIYNMLEVMRVVAKT